MRGGDGGGGRRERRWRGRLFYRMTIVLEIAA